MNEIKRCVGINVTTSRLQIVEVEKESDQLIISNFGQTFISPSINFEKQIDSMFPLQLQTAFDEINIRNPVRSIVASFALPPELFITIQLPYDNELTQIEITEEFRWEISQLFPFISANELAIKFYELGEKILPGNNNAIVVALNKKFLLLLKNFCTKNKLTPRLVDSASLSANRFINTYHFTSNLYTINIYNSRNSVTLFINVSSKAVYVKVFQKTDKDFPNLIAKELSSERLKKYINEPKKNAFISGDEIGAELLSEIQQAIGLNFVKFNPFEIIKLKSDFQSPDISTEHYSAFTAATGIAARFNY